MSRTPALLLLCLLLLVGCDTLRQSPPAATERVPDATSTPAIEQPEPTSTLPAQEAEPTVTTPPTATSSPAPSATPAENVTPAETSADPILAACSGAAQGAPFRDDLEAEFAALSLNICYDLEFTLNERGDAFDAVARVTVRNGSDDSWPALLFRLYPEARTIFGGKMEVGTVTAEGQEVDAERVLSDDTGLLVTLAAPLAPGDVVRVDIPFSGELAGVGQAGVYGIFARSEDAATLVSWFPLLAVWNGEEARWFDVPVLGTGDAVFSESAYIRAALTAPEQFALASSGVVQSEATEDGLTTYEVVTGPVRDFAMVWMDGYEVGEATVNGTLIRNWYLPGGEESAEQTLEAARESMKIFDERFGAYPFEELDIVPVPLSGAAGVEYPQLYLMGQELYGGQGGDFLGFVSAHEMAHQWWYSTVGNDINAAPWQDEALTNWSAVLWLEDGESEAAAQANLDGFEQSVQAYEEQQGEEPIAQPLDSFTNRGNAYATIVYLKGTLFFQALREEIGDEPFFEALQAYYAANRFGIAAPSNLLDQFEESSGRDLDAFYEEWGVTP